MGHDDIQEIKDRNDIVEVVSQYVHLQKAGKGYKGLCPFHEEKTPSFTVSPDKQLWHCFGACQEGGDVIKFVQKIENLPFTEALERLARRAGITLERSSDGHRRPSEREQIYEVNRYATQFFREQLQGSSGQEARAYLRKRGLSAAVVEKFGLGYAPDSWDALLLYLGRQNIPPQLAEKAGLVRRSSRGQGFYDYFRHRLMFPIHDVQGRVTGFGGRILEAGSPKYLNSPETPAFSKGRTLYGLYQAIKAIGENQAVVVMEGYLDVITAHQFGLPQAVATLGTALTAEHLRLLRRYTQRLYICFDADSAGMGAMLRSSELFEAAEVDPRLVLLSDGRDPDEFLRAEGCDRFLILLDQALDLVDYKIRMVFSRYDRHDLRQRSAIMRELVPILAEIRSPIRQSDYLNRAATWWCHPHLERVGWAEQDLRLELRQYLQRRRPSPGPPAASQAPSSPPPIPSGVVRSERWLLGALLSQPDIAPRVRTQLQPEHFTDPLHRILVAAAYAQYDRDGRIDGRTLAEQVPAEAQNLLSGLLLQEEQREKQKQEYLAVEVLIKEIRARAEEARLAEIGRQLQEDLAPAELARLGEEWRRLQENLRQYKEELGGYALPAPEDTP